jgi:hypothetical protein
VESWRVAQLVVDRMPGIDSFRGSGYLVAPGLVLTAAHVLAGASAVQVRLDVGQPLTVDVQAERWWADRGGLNGTDLAVVMIPPGVTAGRDVDMARFGRISDRTAVLTVKALGFPRFKLRVSIRKSCGYRRVGSRLPAQTRAGSQDFRILTVARRRCQVRRAGSVPGSGSTHRPCAGGRQPSSGHPGCLLG